MWADVSGWWCCGVSWRCVGVTLCICVCQPCMYRISSAAHDSNPVWCLLQNHFLCIAHPFPSTSGFSPAAPAECPYVAAPQPDHNEVVTDADAVRNTSMQCKCFHLSWICIKTIQTPAHVSCICHRLCTLLVHFHKFPSALLKAFLLHVWLLKQIVQKNKLNLAEIYSLKAKAQNKGSVSSSVLCVTRSPFVCWQPISPRGSAFVLVTAPDQADCFSCASPGTHHGLVLQWFVWTGPQSRPWVSMFLVRRSLPHTIDRHRLKDVQTLSSSLQARFGLIHLPLSRLA